MINKIKQMTKPYSLSIFLPVAMLLAVSGSLFIGNTQASDTKAGKPGKYLYSYIVRGKKYSVTKHKTGYKQTGIASWYGKLFDGKKTANGEIYNMNGISAASKVLPLGSVVKVKNLKNNKTIKLKINDRGPFVSGRIIDLSYGAAKKLGYAEKGITPVEVTIIS